MSTPADDASELYQIAVFASLAHDPPNIPDERILIPLSLNLWLKGRVSEAVTGFRLLDRSGALPTAGVLAWGWWLLYEAELDKAEELFSRALQMEPDNDEASLGMAFLRFYQEDHSAASRLFSSLAVRGKFSSPKTMAPATQALAEGRRPDEIQPAPLLGLPPGLAHVYQKRQLEGKDAAIRFAQSQVRLAHGESALPVRRLILEWRFEDRKADPPQLRAELETLLKEYPDEGRLWQYPRNGPAANGTAGGIARSVPQRHKCSPTRRRHVGRLRRKSHGGPGIGTGAPLLRDSCFSQPRKAGIPDGTCHMLCRLEAMAEGRRAVFRSGETRRDRVRLAFQSSRLPYGARRNWARYGGSAGRLRDRPDASPGCGSARNP